MAYFCVDDALHGHPKVRIAGLAAMGLWTVGGSHCRAYKSDGFVPTWLIDSWGDEGRAGAADLVAAGLWIVTDGGWLFHDWEDIHDDANMTELQREKGRERQRRRRAKIRETKGGDV